LEVASKRVPAGDIRNVAAARFFAGGGAADVSAWFLLICLMFCAQVAGAAAASTRIPSVLVARHWILLASFQINHSSCAVQMLVYYFTSPRVYRSMVYGRKVNIWAGKGVLQLAVLPAQICKEAARTLIMWQLQFLQPLSWPAWQCAVCSLLLLLLPCSRVNDWICTLPKQ
jgi:hypothetical protein